VDDLLDSSDEGSVASSSRTIGTVQVRRRVYSSRRLCADGHDCGRERWLLYSTAVLDLPLTRSFPGRSSTAALLVRAGLLIVWLQLNVSGFRPVLACGWHRVRAHGSEDDRSPAIGPVETPSRICLPGVTSRPAAGSCIHTVPGGDTASKSLYWMVTCGSVIAELITSRALDRSIPMTLGMSGVPDSRMVMVDGNRPASLCPVLPIGAENLPGKITAQGPAVAEQPTRRRRALDCDLGRREDARHGGRANPGMRMTRCRVLRYGGSPPTDR
jgi:hypothetical protein